MLGRVAHSILSEKFIFSLTSPVEKSFTVLDSLHVTCIDGGHQLQTAFWWNSRFPLSCLPSVSANSGSVEFQAEQRGPSNSGSRA